FEQGHRLFSIEQLRCDGGAPAMAGDVAARIGPRYSRLPTERRNEHVIQVAFAHNGQTKEEQKINHLASLWVGKFHAFGSNLLPGSDALAHNWIDWLGEGRRSFIYWHVEHADRSAGQYLHRS